MAIHVLISDPRVIDFGHADLRTRVEASLKTQVALCRPFPFVEHSGFSETVREEIGLVLGNHSADEPPLREFDDFVKGWELSDLLDRRVLDLSGGWRKYLGLALFMNRSLPARLLLDATSHLSDARMVTLLTRAAEFGDVIFCEYDPALLLTLQSRVAVALPALQRLHDDGTNVKSARAS